MLGFTYKEKNVLSLLLNLGYINIIRHVYPEKIGVYTYFTNYFARELNLGKRQDYFLYNSFSYLKQLVLQFSIII